MKQVQSQLIAFIKANKHQGSYEAYQHIQPFLDQLHVLDLLDVFNELLKTESPNQIIEFIDRIIHVLALPLNKQMVQLPVDSILDHLQKENLAFKSKLENIQKSLQQKSPIDKKDLAKQLAELLEFEPHHQKIQNVIIPLLEKAEPKTVGLKILWSYQNKTKKTLKELIKLTHQQDDNQQKLNQVIGSYFFLAFGLMQKEELILFQMALQIFSKEQLKEARILCQEFESCYIEPLEMLDEALVNHTHHYFVSETGSLSFDQLKLILNSLPVDITFIDQNDKVVFFNRPIERIFARSAAVIGRDVRNCHPAHSVDTVNEILDAFKNKTQLEADFWIQMKGKFLYIRYLALYNQKQEYQGCLEISQEISKIKALSGEKRLLSWNQNDNKE